MDFVSLVKLIIAVALLIVFITGLAVFVTFEADVRTNSGAPFMTTDRQTPHYTNIDGMNPADVAGQMFYIMFRDFEAGIFAVLGMGAVTVIVSSILMTLWRWIS